MNDYDVPFSGCSVVYDNQGSISQCIPVVVAGLVVVGAVLSGAVWCIPVGAVEFMTWCLKLS